MTRPDYPSGGGGGISRGIEVALRVLAMLLTLTATIVMGIEKQTQVVPVTLASGLPPIYISVTAKSHQVSALVYFVVANAIASALSLLSILLSFTKRKGGITTIFTDVITVALLFSAVGASAGIGWIGFKGNSHLRWNKICNVFGKYCHGLLASIILSFVASLLHLLLVLLAARNLDRRSSK